MAQVNIYSSAPSPTSPTHTCLITHQASHVPTKDIQLHPSSYTSTHAPCRAVIYPATEQQHPQKSPLLLKPQAVVYDILPVTHSLRHRGCADCNQNVSRFGPAVRRVSRGTLVRICFSSPFSSKVVVCGHSCDFVPHN